MNDEFNEIELRKLDLNLLLTFSAVMRCGSAQAAADRLGIGTSAVSMALARLRDALGIALFERTSKGLLPTPAAEAFWAQIAPALGQISNAARVSDHFAPLESTTTFSLALPDDLSPWLAPRISEALFSVAPHTRLKLRQSDFKRNLTRLDSREVDLALGATPVEVKNRHIVDHVCDEGFMLLYDPRAFDVPGPITIDTYLDAEQLLLSPAGDFESAIDRRLVELGLGKRRVATSVEHFSLFPGLLKGRPVLAAMPATGAKLYAAETSLAVSPLPFDAGTFPLSWHWSYRSETDPGQRWFRQLAASALEKVFDLATKG